MSALFEFDEDNFESEVLGSTIPVIIEFCAPWCAPCQKQEVILEKFAEDNVDIKVGRINIDKNKALANKYAVRGIPTIMSFDNGNKHKTKIGILEIDDLKFLVK